MLLYLNFRKLSAPRTGMGIYALERLQALEVFGKHIPIVNEGVLRRSRVHESGLQPLGQVLNDSLENTPHYALLGRMLDFQVLELAVLQYRNPCFQAFNADDDFLFIGFLPAFESKHIFPFFPAQRTVS